MGIDQVIPKNIDLSKYRGQWVVICNNKLIAHNKNLKEIQKDIDSCKQTPTVAKIPEGNRMIF